MKRLNNRGQSLVEFALVLPFLMLVVLGVVEVGYVLLDQHVVTKMSREGSNLISRNTTLDDAVTAMKGMSTRPVNLDANSRLIFSVIKKVATVGTPNYNKEVLYQRHAYGSLSAASAIATRGGGAFSGPDHSAPNSDSDTNLQVTNLPPGMVTLGGMLYVTEIYTTHPLLTPLQRFGVTVPQTLYSVAYF
ncbi:MAG: pilus assembly protein [Vicinamibacterales bacterium]|nr:pilus assembly protein [Vicinamibacterales bacterium]